LVGHARGLQNGGVFTREARDVLREHLLSMASSDDRIVGGAVLGSRARGGGDEWSDLDIMFAVREDLSVIDVLDDWTTRIAETSARRSSSTCRAERPSIGCFCFGTPWSSISP
jgi:hypothetical protein